MGMTQIDMGIDQNSITIKIEKHKNKKTWWWWFARCIYLCAGSIRELKRCHCWEEKWWIEIGEEEEEDSDGRWETLVWRGSISGVGERHCRELSGIDTRECLLTVTTIFILFFPFLILFFLLFIIFCEYSFPPTWRSHSLRTLNFSFWVKKYFFKERKSIHDYTSGWVVIET